MGDIATERKHGEMLPSTIRAIICGPSNCAEDTALEKRFKPIVEPLKQIVEKTEESQSIKREAKDLDPSKEPPLFLQKEDVFETKDVSEPSFETTIKQSLQTQQGREALHNQLGPLGQKRGHSAHNPIKGNRGSKYINIIAPLVSTYGSSGRKKGAGFQLHFFYFFFFFSNIVQYYIFNFHSISVERRAVRLLSRRYTLTATGYKFLEIGINVGPPSYVEIALGDHRGQELILSLETWKGLYEQRWNIYKLLLNDYKDNFISVGPLTVRICLMNDVTLVRLESLNVRVTMIESTLRRMFALNECIDVTFDRLVRFVDTIDTKYTRFSNIASVVTDPEEVPNAIRDCDIFDRRQLVDCELLALVFSV
ncbi:hypothetical protein P5V15_014776 [Pogonomyrmex californicus]